MGRWHGRCFRKEQKSLEESQTLAVIFAKVILVMDQNQNDILKGNHTIFVRKIILKNNYDLIHSLFKTECVLTIRR